MKALILFGSPRANGDCMRLVNEFIKNFEGEVDFAYAYLRGKGEIGLCLGCEACKKVPCVLHDQFDKLKADDYDVLVIASPIYYSNLPGSMFNVISRFNYMFWSEKRPSFRPKKGVLILTAGGHACKSLMGETNEDLPIKQAKYIFKRLNATLDEGDMVLSLHTDTLPASADTSALQKIADIAKKLRN